MRFEVLTEVKLPMLVFWVVTPCGKVDRYQHFGGFNPEDGGSVFLRNVDIYLQVYTALQPRGTTIDNTLIIYKLYFSS
jgi:hypothetical protein